MGMAKKRFGLVKPSKGRAIVLFLAGLVIAAYGLAVFLRRELPSYMLLQNEFVFLDYDEPKLLFYLDYLAMMGLFVFIAHYLTKALKKLSAPKARGGKRNERGNHCTACGNQTAKQSDLQNSEADRSPLQFPDGSGPAGAVSRI